MCNPCYDSNLEGVSPETHPKLSAYLQSKGIEAQLNDKGPLDWPRRNGE